MHLTFVGLARLCQSRPSLPATFREAFEGKQDQLVEKINTADYSGLLLKLQAKSVITRRHKRHLHVIDVVGCYCVIDILTC